MKRAATLEMPDYSATDQIIVLSAPAGINVKVWHTGIKIAYLGSHAQPTPDSHVQAPAKLENTSRSSCFPRIVSKKLQLRVFAEMAVSSTQAKPGRKWRLRKQIRAQRWSNEDRTVLLGDHIDAVVDVFIGVIDDRDFDGQSGETFSAFQSCGQVCLEAESI